MKLCALLELRERIVLSHFFTEVYVLHKTTGDLYEALDDFIDTYTETYIGVNGRDAIDLTESEESTEKPTAADSIAVSNLVEELAEAIRDLDAPTADLVNLRDEFLGKVQRAQYMLTLQ